jgi:hypothetical protein
MIQETLVTTLDSAGQLHIAPMGIHVTENKLIILPFRPSTTLTNLLASGVAVINYCNDVRVFAGCVTGRRDWPVKEAEKINGKVLVNTLAHSEIELVCVEDDAVRPKLFCKVIHTVNHAPFPGFNRAQFSVLEASILLSRIKWLPMSKIETELEYLRIGLEKTACAAELDAWDWIMTAIDNYKQESQKHEQDAG